ncbi:hypothetical protein EU78_24335 [Mycolicibacterium rufum]|nr:hypothetical protein EU78_24335 [Mycolicibacterium rufum]
MSGLQAHTTYVGKSTLVVASPNRLTDQDAVIVQGYVQLFNDEAVNARLAAKSQLPLGVEVQAATAASSPILSVDATASDPRVAQDAAEKMAGAFRNDINSMQQARLNDSIKAAERRLAQVTANGTPEDPAEAAALQNQIMEMSVDRTNELQVLQPRAGVTEVSPQTGLQIALGAIGGLALGILAALALATVSTRLKNLDDIREKTPVEPLVEIPAGGHVHGRERRQERVRTLANLVSLEDLPKNTAVVVVNCSGTRAPSPLAGELAGFWARQGYRTVLVGADPRGWCDAESPGFLEALDDSTLVHSLLRDSDIESLKILPGGRTDGSDWRRITRERVAAVLDEIRTVADVIVMMAPPVTASADAQLICAAADLTILAVVKNVTRAGDVTAAAGSLSKAHADVFGAVLIDVADAEPAPRPVPSAF